MMNKECESLRDFLYVLDAGDALPEIGRVRAHLAACPDCRAESERIAVFDADLSEVLGEVEVPEDLVARVARIPSQPPVTVRRRRRRVWGAAGAFVAMAAAVAAFLLAGGGGLPEDPAELAREAVADHNSHLPTETQDMGEVGPAQIGTDDPAALLTFHRLHQEMHARGFALVYCGLCRWGRTSVPHAYYRKGGEIVSVFLFPGEAPWKLQAKVVELEQQGKHVRLLRPESGAPAAIVGDEIPVGGIS